MARPRTTKQWALLATDGTVFICRDKEHAEGMNHSTSVMLGPKEGRRVVWRHVTEWTDEPDLRSTT